MSGGLERLWTTVIDSDRFRRLVKYGAGARLLRHPVYRDAHMARRYLVTAWQAWRSPALFRDVQAFCAFIGHTKSGGTLLGSLLDAHPDVLLADEEDALKYISAGFRRDQLFHLLVKGSRRAALKGRVTARRLEPYSLHVPGGWQGRHRRLLAIGDSKAGATTQRLGEDPALLDRLQLALGGARLVLVHVVRNPYDPISIMMVRGRRTFENAVEHYFGRCEMLAAIRQTAIRQTAVRQTAVRQTATRQAGLHLHTVRYEDFVAKPEAHLSGLCAGLGVDADPDYLAACAGIVYPEPQRSRTLVEWTPERIRAVAERIPCYDFLDGYTYDS